MASISDNTTRPFRPPETKADFEQFWSERIDGLAAALNTEIQEQEQAND